MPLEFSVIKQAVQRRFNEIKTATVYQSDINKDELWELYLASFPEGSNPRFRERTEHDCSCCRSFIKQAGGMVNIVNGEIKTLWDIQAGGYQPVVDALAEYVRSKPIQNVFLHSERAIGTDKNHEDTDAGLITWDHYHLKLPDSLCSAKNLIGPRLGEYRVLHDGVLRSLLEITPDAIETVQDLIAQNSLYRGAEKLSLLNAFAVLKMQISTVPEAQRDNFAWAQVIGPNAFVCRMRNDVIGTLLVALSNGEELEASVRAYEAMVAPTNYKRPTALITPKMRDMAKATLTELGLIASLDRRYACLEDVSITNVLFADRNAKTRMAGDVFDDLPVKGQQTKNFDKVEELPIERFISEVLPRATSLEVMVENRHTPNLVSLIAPYDLTAPSLFKWDNPFSWSYNGDVTDSIKERVKSAGGNVTGDVCCRLAWHNYDDLDLHMQEPSFQIYFGGTHSPRSGGELDVDMNAARGETRTPIENIFYKRKEAIPDGRYRLYVHQFNRREMIDPGFEIEIDVLGTVYHFSYDKAVSGAVDVAYLDVTAAGITVVPILPSAQASKQVWGLQTQQFHPVTALMLSPNFWDGHGIGNKHYIFAVDGCKNDGSARGFYNEFLKSELESHRKAMELVGAKMRTDKSDDQLSGLGFSSTQRNSLLVKVSGSFNRTLKVIF